MSVVPNWLRMSRWLERASRSGARWASEHPAEGAMFAFAICAVMVILALGQAAWHWHGTRSAIALAVGTTAGLALVMSLPRLKRRSTASYQSALSLGSTLGGLAVIPTL